ACARKRESLRLRQRCLEQQHRSSRDRRVDQPRVPRRELVNENIWATGFCFITMINCKQLRRNRHDCCSFFLLRRISRHRDVIAAPAARGKLDTTEWCKGQINNKGLLHV